MPLTVEEDKLEFPAMLGSPVFLSWLVLRGSGSLWARNANVSLYNFPKHKSTHSIIMHVLLLYQYFKQNPVVIPGRPNLQIFDLWMEKILSLDLKLFLNATEGMVLKKFYSSCKFLLTCSTLCYCFYSNRITDITWSVGQTAGVARQMAGMEIFQYVKVCVEYEVD